MVTDQTSDLAQDSSRIRRFLTLGPSAPGLGDSPEALHDWVASPHIASHLSSLRGLDELFIEFQLRDGVRATIKAILATLESPESTTAELLGSATLFLRLCEAPISATILGTAQSPRATHARTPRQPGESPAAPAHSHSYSPRVPLPASATNSNGVSSRAPASADDQVNAAATRANSPSPVRTSAAPVATPTSSAQSRAPSSSAPAASSMEPAPRPAAAARSPVLLTDRKRPAADLLACAGSARPRAKSAAWP